MLALTLLAAISTSATTPGAARAAESMARDLFDRASECADRARNLSSAMARDSWNCVVETTGEFAPLKPDLRDSKAWSAKFSALADEARAQLAAGADDVDETHPRVVALRDSLKTLRRLRDAGDLLRMPRILRQMRTTAQELERDSLNGKRSVIARAMISEGEELCSSSGDDPGEGPSEADPGLARLEARRDALKRKIEELDGEFDPASQARADNLRGDLMEVERQLRGRTGARR